MNPSSTQPGTIYSDHHLASTPGLKGSTSLLCKEPAGKLAGYSAIPFSFGFISPSSYPDYRKFKVDPTFAYSEKYGNIAIFRDANKVWALSDYGRYGFDTLDGVGIQGWKDLTERNNAVTYSQPTKTTRLLRGPEIYIDNSKYGMTPIPVPVTRLEGQSDLREVGYNFSKINNSAQLLRDFTFTNPFYQRPGRNLETEALFAFFDSELSGHGRRLSWIGVENMKALAATYYLKDGTAALVFSGDFYEKALNMAKSYGLKGEDAVKFAQIAVTAHESYHIRNRLSLLEADDEATVGELLNKFFSQRASMLEGKIAQFYRAMAAENRDYAEGWRSGRVKSASLKARIDAMARKYMAEARSKGMSNEEATEYAANRVEEDIEREMSDLEKTVEEESAKEDNKPESKQSKYNDNKTNYKAAANDNNSGAANDNNAKSEDNNDEAADTNDSQQSQVAA